MWYKDPLVGPGYREIYRTREHHKIVQNVNTMRVLVEEVRKQLDFIKHLIKQVEERMSE